MSIASAVGKPLAVDKATQDRTRPSTARVKVLLDLLDKHPKKVKIHIVDYKSGKLVDHYQDIKYDNLPKFYTCCKHQGHDEKSCRWWIENNQGEVEVVDEREGLGSLDKLQGDARAYLNAKRSGHLEGETTKERLVEQQDSQIVVLFRTKRMQQIELLMITLLVMFHRFIRVQLYPLEMCLLGLP